MEILQVGKHMQLPSVYALFIIDNMEFKITSIIVYGCSFYIGLLHPTYLLHI